MIGDFTTDTHSSLVCYRFRPDEGALEGNQESEAETGGLHPHQRPSPTTAGGETGPNHH